MKMAFSTRKWYRDSIFCGDMCCSGLVQPPGTNSSLEAKDLEFCTKPKI